MFKNLVIAVSAVACFAACGVPSDVALGGGIEGEAEVANDARELSSSRAQSWLPLGEGNRWELTSKTSSKVISVEYFQNNVALITGLMPTELWVGLAPSTPNSLYAWDDNAQNWNTMIRFGYAATPWKWSTSATCRSFDARRVATGVKIATPAGEFADTRVISFSQIGAPNVRCEHPAFTELAFAANVGLVSLTADGETFVLKAAKVGNKQFPAGLTVTVKSDKQSYANVPNSIRCIAAPCPSNELTAEATFTMTVTNNSQVAQKLEYGSGRHFDFEVQTEGGKTVRAYGDGRMYTQVFSTEILQPGQSTRFIATMPLKDRDGVQLSGGFRVHGIVPVIAGTQPTLEAFSAFTVTMP